MTSAGAGKAWITSFVGYNLAEIDNKFSFLKNTIQTIKNSPYEFLSYNHSIFQDGDSINFLLGFLSKMNEPTQTIKEGWLKFINENGGWQTYTDAEALRERLDLPSDISVEAWLSPKLCVSAVACYILDVLQDATTFNKTASFLIENRTDNYWKSYWWTSPIYATSYAIMALSKKQYFNQICEESSEWLINLQAKNGFWLNPYNNSPNPFYTALALKALMSFDKKEYSDSINKGIRWLIDNQTTDGSWQSNRILQIPATDVEDVSSVKSWRNSSFGVNCVSDDYNRVFTTSMVVNCLATYKKFSKC
jgi:hypothetical protein